MTKPGHTQPPSSPPPEKWDSPQGHKADCGFVYGKECTCGWTAFCNRPRRSPDRTFALDVKGELEFAAQYPPEAGPLPDAEPESAEAFEQWRKSQPFCIDYPDCDGCLPGMNHSEKCPLKTPGTYTDVTWLDVWNAGAASRDKRVKELEAEVKHWKDAVLAMQDSAAEYATKGERQLAEARAEIAELVNTIKLMGG